MKIRTLISKLNELNISLKLEGEQLKVSASKESLTEDIIKEIQQHKQEMIIFLKSIGNDSSYESIKAQEYKEYYPLSSAQKRLYVLQKTEGDVVNYNLPIILKLEGNLNIEKLKEVFRKLVQRHEMLRTSFIVVSGEVMQKVHNNIVFDLKYDEKKEAEVNEYINNFIKPFDLEKAPLLRGVLVKIAENEFVLLIDMHHIITDGVSFKILSKELMDLYSGEDLPKLKVNYIDYAGWQNERKNNGELDSIKDYWLSEFKTEPPIINLPYDYQRPAQFKYKGDMLEIDFKNNLKERIKHWMDSNKISGFMFFFSIYKILLSKMSGQQDIVVGVPIANRIHTDLEKIIGMFVNTLAIRSYPDEEKSYIQYLNEIKEKSINSFENQEYQLDELVEKLNIQREINRNPLFDVVFAMQNMDIPDLEMSGVKIQAYPMDFKTSKFDLTVTAMETDDSYAMQFDYNAELFTRETILKFAEYFKKIVTIVLSDSSILLKDIELLSEKEKAKILTWSDKNKNDIPRKSIIDHFYEQVNKNPEKDAIVYNGRHISYKELDEKSNQFSNLLRKKDIKTNDKVGIMSEDAIEMALSVISVIKLGAIFVPIGNPSSKLQLEKIVNDCGINVLIKSQNLKVDTDCVIHDINETGFCNESVVVSKNNELNNGGCYGIISANIKNKIIYVTQENVLDISIWTEQNICSQYSGDLNITTLAPISNNAFILRLFSTILNGHKLYVPSKFEKSTNTNLLSYFAHNKIHISDGLPSHLNNIASLEEDLFIKIDIKHFIIDGGQINKKVLSTLFKKIKNLKVCSNYIVPETNQIGATIEINENNIGEYDKNIIGYQLTNPVLITTLGDTIQSIGLKGHFCIENDKNWFKINNKKRFKTKNGEHDNAYFKTADFVKWLPDGRIEYCERIDSTVKVGWDVICLEEIKEFIQNYPEIDEAYVIVDKDNQGYLDIYFEAENEIPEDNLNKYFYDSIYSEELLIKFNYVKKLPRLNNGSVDEASILAKNQLVEGEINKEIENGLYKIWKKLLKKEEIDREANFFSIGGNSLKALMLVNEINKEYNKKLLVTDIFDHLTIKDLSIYLNSSEVKVEKFEEISKIPDNEHYQASSAQKRLYVIYELDKGSVAYNIPFVYEIKGDLDITKIEKIFKILVNRHDSLRTYFEIIKDQPVQKIIDNIDFKITVFENREEKDISSIMSDLVKPFDLSKAPLIRIILIKSNNKNYLFIDVHHIVVDGVSVGILVDEFKKLYMGEKLPALDIQYKDFAKWQSKENEKIEEQEKYWINEFEGEIPVLNLPNDFKRPLVKEFGGENENFAIGGKDVKILEKLAIKEKGTFNMLMLSIYNVFLHKLSGDEDIIVGMPVGGREHAGLGNMVGMFLNTLAIRSYPSADKTFIEYFNEVKEKVLSANLNQLYPFEELIDKVGVERDTGRNPIFDAMLVYQEFDGDAFTGMDIELEPYVFSNKTAKFDLTLFGTKKEDIIAFNFEYSTDLFKNETIKRFAKYFKKIIKAIANDSTIKISDIELIDESERNNLMKISTGIKKQWNKDETILSCFEKIVIDKPEKQALFFGNNSMTYKELNEKANQLAQLLLQKGTKPNDIIGLMVTRSFEMIIGLFAIMKVRGGCLPIDLKYPEDRKLYMLEDSKVKLLLTNFEIKEESYFPKQIDTVNISKEHIYAGNHKNIDILSQSNDLIYIIYTSGSTGIPKGVMMEQKNLYNLIKFDQYGTSILTNKTLQFASISFDMSFNEIFLTLLSGGKLYLIGEDIQSDIDELLKYIDLNNIETLVLPMSVLKVIFNDEAYTNKIAKGVKHIITAGEQVLVSNMFREVLIKNNITLHNHYGPSETHVVTTLELNPINEIPELPSIGKPIYNTNIYIIDKGNNLTPIGIAGELCVTGEQVGRGYLGKAKLTEERFIACPFEEGTKMYKTGDLARWLPNGNIEFLGRIDKQLKIRGYRVEPGEIESQIMKFEGVKEVVVIVQSANREKNLCAYIVANNSFDIKKIKGFLLNKIPDYMVPAYFILVNKIPITSNGKIDFKKLPEPVIKTAGYVAPQNDIEKSIVKLWSEVLNIESSEISIDADFFELGGHSLKATVIISKMHKEFNVKIKLNELFRFSTIRELSGIIIQNQQEYAMSNFEGEESEELEEFLV